ncbi:archease [Candidatus Dependentiae bacterium]|nr:archease [Candidatus Dependentiae bacterium]
MAQEFELLSHTADSKIRAYGITLEELFRNTLKGMFASIKPYGTHITYKNDELICSKFTLQHTVTTHSLDLQSLLVDFLSDCLYLSDIHNEAYFDARFTLLTSTELQCSIFGVPIAGFELLEIKAVTYNDLAIEQNQDGIWQATVVFDI